MDYNKYTNKITIPTAYLPPIEYFSFMAKTEAAAVELHETFPRQSWRNRCTILTANGLLNLIIPIYKPHGNQSKTINVSISTHEHWQKKHWRSLVSAYNKAPYFFYYQDLFAPFFLDREIKKLWEFNNALLQLIANELGITTSISFTDDYERDITAGLDLRNVLTPKTHRRPALNKIAYPTYQQVFSDRFGFAANLSIVDLLFNVGPEASTYLEALKV